MKRHQADDVVQETARVLWQKFASYDPERPFWPWARQIASGRNDYLPGDPDVPATLSRAALVRFETPERLAGICPLRLKHPDQAQAIDCVCVIALGGRDSLCAQAHLLNRAAGPGGGAASNGLSPASSLRLELLDLCHVLLELLELSLVGLWRQRHLTKVLSEPLLILLEIRKLPLRLLQVAQRLRHLRRRHLLVYRNVPDHIGD